jgi:hypothetical protein
MPSTVRDLITSAFREIGIAPLVGDLPAELATLGLNTTNTFLDQWNAKEGAAFAQLISSFTLSIGTNPHTIGPSSATWTLTQRPVAIDALTIIDGTARIPVDVTMTAAEYQALADHSVTSTYPRRLWFNPTYPNGSIYFDVVPDAAKTVHVLSRRQLSALTIGDSWSFPQGYEAAIKHTLKEQLLEMPMFASAASMEVQAKVARAASEARAVIFDNNADTPRLCTADSGLMGGGGVYDHRLGPLLQR